MCGIAGFFDGTLTSDAQTQLVDAMLCSIAHRGPDSRGVWIEGPVVLGHNRLSIIDLSDDGKQPMCYFDAVIAYNGEIYNYIEVREELIRKGYRFQTKSDTEVILAAWREYGVDCVDHFIGMWAFALWDLRTSELFCSRDRFGIKPFYFICRSKKFYFGSEYKPLKLSPLFHNDVNWGHVMIGLQLGWNHFPDSNYFSVIETLKPAHNLLFKQGKFITWQYWDLNPDTPLLQSGKSSMDRFRSLFLDSVRLQMRSDVEVGGCLSGGLDSSSISAAVASMFPDAKYKTFTSYYDGVGDVDERPWVRSLLDRYPSLSPSYIKPTEDQIAQEFDRIIFHADVPIAGSSPISQYFVMKLARQEGVKVLLDGQGSDEFLGGYMHSFYRSFADLIRGFSGFRFVSQLNAHADLQSMSIKQKLKVSLISALSSLFNDRRLFELEYKRHLPFLGYSSAIPFRLKVVTSNRFRAFTHMQLFKTSLPTLLQYEDRNSMAFGIEARVPFLDHRLVELAWQMPSADIQSNGVTKKVLRDGLEGILPESIRMRYDKKGFVTPGETKWLRGGLRFLLDDSMDQHLPLNHSKIRAIFQEFRAGSEKNAVLVWRLAVLNYWIKKL